MHKLSYNCKNFTSFKNHFSLVINVKDKEHIGASFIASVTIPSETLLTEETIDGK